MPKIIIREIDKTKAGQTEYSNFSVVVPGFLGTPELGYSFDDVADANGIYECDSQSDFITYVGKKAGATHTVAAKAPTLKNLAEESGEVYIKALTPVEFYETYKGIAYTIAVDPTATEVGYLVFKNESSYVRCTLATSYTSGEGYVVIEKGNEGNDKVEIPYNGNQIAYELLGLGYTVLFKKISSAITELDDASFWECLKDKATYDFRYICTGGYASVDAYHNIIKVAAHKSNEKLTDTEIAGRGDCIALIDLADDGISTIKDIRDQTNTIFEDLEDKEYLTKYAAVFCPSITYDMVGETDYGKNTTFPASFHYLACAAYSINELNYKEWFAMAGYTRGICSRKVIGTPIKLGEIAVNALQPRIQIGSATEGITKYSVNIVENIRNNYYLWGNRTAEILRTKDDEDPGLIASHFLNIRQLCCTLKKSIYNTCRKLTFDPNSDILWGKFCNAVKVVLDDMKANEGIRDYKIIKVKDTTKALLTAKIRIVPIEAVEDFDISIFLEDSISGIDVKSDEE